MYTTTEFLVWQVMWLCHTLKLKLNTDILLLPSLALIFNFFETGKLSSASSQYVIELFVRCLKIDISCWTSDFDPMLRIPVVSD